jgi:hypothetical protein
MQNANKDRSKEIDFIKLVETESNKKYPPGSIIAFDTSHVKSEGLKTASCTWYNKVGGNPRLSKNSVVYPPEWKNIPIKKAYEIMNMFDDYICCGLVYATKRDEILSENNIGLKIIAKPRNVQHNNKKR